MKALLVAALLLAAAVPCLPTPAAAFATAAKAAPRCSGVANPFPVWSGTPELIKTVPNGKMFTAGAGNDTFTIVHLYGTPYQKGVAQGQLRPEAIKKTLADIPEFIESMIEHFVPWLPASIVDAIVNWGAPIALHMCWGWVSSFVTDEYLSEMQGIADGAGAKVADVQNFNMFPELTKAACTIVGANGPATPLGTLMQFRALDFSPKCPIKDYAQVTVYHSSGPNEATFLTVGWAAMIGALTGFSEAGVGIGEKVWDHHPQGADGVHGKPWMFMLRDVLKYTTTMPEALSSIKNSNRTCAIHVGVGTASDNEFRGLTVAAHAYDVYTDTTLNYTAHPILPGVVYWNKHTQPSTNPCLGDLLSQSYGKLTAHELAIQVAAIGETGDMHAVTFDYSKKVMFVANARKTNVTSGNLNAYNRQFSTINMASLFAVTQGE